MQQIVIQAGAQVVTSDDDPSAQHPRLLVVTLPPIFASHRQRMEYHFAVVRSSVDVRSYDVVRQLTALGWNPGVAPNEEGLRRYMNELWASEFAVPSGSLPGSSTLLNHVPHDQAAFSNILGNNATAGKWWTTATNLYTTLHRCFQASSPRFAPISIGQLIDINSMLMAELSSEVGSLRKHGASPAGYNLTYCQPVKISDMLRVLLELFNRHMTEIDGDTTQAPHVRLDRALKTAGVFFAWLLYIHPFDDGNGRTCRIVLSMSLRPFTVVPLSLYRDADSRTHYLGSLFKFHQELDDYPTAFINFLLDCARLSVSGARSSAMAVECDVPAASEGGVAS